MNFVSPSSKPTLVYTVVWDVGAGCLQTLFLLIAWVSTLSCRNEAEKGVEGETGRQVRRREFLLPESTQQWTQMQHLALASIFSHHLSRSLMLPQIRTRRAGQQSPQRNECWVQGALLQVPEVPAAAGQGSHLRGPSPSSEGPLSESWGTSSATFSTLPGRKCESDPRGSQTLGSKNLSVFPL